MANGENNLRSESVRTQKSIALFYLAVCTFDCLSNTPFVIFMKANTFHVYPDLPLAFISLSALQSFLLDFLLCWRFWCVQCCVGPYWQQEDMFSGNHCVFFKNLYAHQWRNKVHYVAKAAQNVLQQGNIHLIASILLVSHRTLNQR